MNLSPRTRLNKTESSAQRDLRCQCAPTRTRHRRRNDRASDVFDLYPKHAIYCKNRYVNNILVYPLRRRVKSVLIAVMSLDSK